ncbi:DUF418 domain-containing protein [Pseudidiomarina sediminum]|uniref:DUF418 domain-containing protein n=1 Tax=Pseudidiomarina sediminum TaxID=431675 RepID=UPI001C9713E7|nr:DUF418 domain-containing protein [Pseudidiomarina sediminum]MBY6062885.1 DUF418 domain-containing protein [Pseudidiomarina sediminum]
MSTITPIGVTQRLVLLDILRGFALLGILLMNMEFFQRPLLAGALGFDQSLTGLDRTVGLSVYTLVQGKFYTLFSMLFGIGFILFYERLKATHAAPHKLYRRRLFWLALIGATHIALVWAGDILFMYAVAGYFLVFFRNLRADILWKLGLVFIFAPVALFWLGALSIAAVANDPTMSAEFMASINNDRAELLNTLTLANQAYQSGSFAEVMQVRLQEYFGSGVLFMAPIVLGTFMIGGSLARYGLFVQEQDSALYGKIMRRSLLVGLPLAVYVGLFGNDIDYLLPTVQSALSFTLMTIANLALALFYMTGLAWLWHRRAQPTWLARLAPAGRMALTHYLLQTVFFTTLFYGYGFGFYDDFGRATTTLAAVIFWLLQVAISPWWLARFQYGPCEWLWRSLTYKTWLPFKKSPTN